MLLILEKKKIQIEDMGLANQTSPSESLDNLSVKIDSITSTVGTLRDQFKLVGQSEEPYSYII